MVFAFSLSFSKLLVRMFKAQNSWQNSTTLGTKRGNTLFCPNGWCWNILHIISWDSACGSGWDISHGSVRSLDPAISRPCPEQVASRVWLSSYFLKEMLWDMRERWDTENVGISSLGTSQGGWDKPRNLKSFSPVKLEFSLPKRQCFLLQCNMLLTRNILNTG